MPNLRTEEQTVVEQDTWTLADVISWTAESGESAWYLAPAANRMLVGRVLDQLTRLSLMTGWDIRDLPAKLGCRGIKRRVDELKSEELEQSSDFLEVLINLISSAIVSTEDLRFTREHARYAALLVLRTQRASRRYVAKIAEHKTKQEQNDLTLGLTITAVTTVRTKGDSVSLADVEEMHSRTMDLRDQKLEIGSSSAFDLLRSIRSSSEIDSIGAYAPADEWFTKPDTA